MTIIVEGKYDKIRLINLTDLPVISTDGFNVFSDPAKINMLKKAAANGGVLILTDSDRAGFQIRRKLESLLALSGDVRHAYIPDIYGKESRKKFWSAEKKLGVEGIPDEVLQGILDKSYEKGGFGLFSPDASQRKIPFMNKQRLFSDRLSGSENSGKIRRELCKKLRLPENLSSKGIVSVLNSCFSEEEYSEALNRLKKDGLIHSSDFT